MKTNIINKLITITNSNHHWMVIGASAAIIAVYEAVSGERVDNLKPLNWREWATCLVVAFSILFCPIAIVLGLALMRA